MDIPINVSTGMVTGRYIADIVDGIDAGSEPDVIAMRGSLVFMSSVEYLPVPTAIPDPLTIMRHPIVGVLDAEGYLCTPYPDSLEPQYRGIRLIATDDPNVAVKDWTWDVTYIFEAVGGKRSTIKPHGFSLPAGEPQDLTRLAKVPSSPGYSLPQAEAAALRAEGAASSSAADAALAAESAERAEQAAGATDTGVAILLDDPGTAAGGLLEDKLKLKADTDSVYELLVDKADKTALALKADASVVSGIAPDDGVRAIGKGELLVNVEDYGDVWDGIADNAAALQAAGNAAKAVKATLWVPNALRVRVESSVDLRFIDVKFDGFLTVGAGAMPYGVLVGDSSNVRVGRKISFKSALHVNNATQNNPCIRVQGLMGGDVEVGRCDYVQIYANETEEPGTGDACAYATYRFTGGSVRHLELLGEGGQSWINENLFLGGDFRKITIGGTYTHNSNTLIKPSIEGVGSLLDIQRGSRNKFLNARGEYGPKIKFGAQTWQNVVQDGFVSNAQSRTPGFTVEEDFGVENVLVASIDEFLEPHTVFRLDNQARVFDTAASYPGLPVRPGLSALKVNGSFQQIVRTPIIPLTAGTSRVRRFEFSSDAALWRPRIRMYGADRAQLDASTLTLMDMSGGWSSAGGADPYYQFGAAKDNCTVLITSPLVAFVSIEIQSSSSTAGLMFNRLSVAAFRHGRDGDGLIDMWRRAFIAPLFGAKPTQGRGWPGIIVEGASGRSVCTAAVSSTLTAAAATTDTALTMASTAGMAAADVVGVLLVDGGTHWSTIATVGSGTQLSLSTGVTGAAAVGAAIEAVRWVTR